MELEKLIAELKKLYPHGHPKFIELCISEMDLHSRKNHDYASGGHPLGNFYRRAAIYRLYPNLDLGDPSVVAMVDLMKQLDAALWMKSQRTRAKVEDVPTRMKDVSIYSKIDMLLEEDYSISMNPTPTKETKSEK